jgi:hypothetical protein
MLFGFDAEGKITGVGVESMAGDLTAVIGELNRSVGADMEALLGFKLDFWDYVTFGAMFITLGLSGFST